jgi:hypothetical protein
MPDQPLKNTFSHLGMSRKMFSGDLNRVHLRKSIRSYLIVKKAKKFNYIWYFLKFPRRLGESEINVRTDRGVFWAQQIKRFHGNPTKKDTITFDIIEGSYYNNAG